jgi:hypothetical protein
MVDATGAASRDGNARGVENGEELADFPFLATNSDAQVAGQTAS